ncbi:hypothetical protein [Thalassoglobus polymorphus]|uniref:Uncharacterized protein n=1 Tax=Thalassoglobus polymorphus TaxID=2527994 RepID=A0A517QUI6_9PLAN|nr:hypothetical protein [Thalassoglobus polymorphus]QDT35312.1 hypothetical protein Mal48_45880 [Thalassoglobus polymorphus]
MRIQEQKVLTAWPGWLLGLLIACVLADVFLKIVDSSVPVSFLGAIPFLVLTVFGITFCRKQNPRALASLILGSILACLFTASLISFETPLSMGISAAMFGIVLCVIPLTAAFVNDSESQEPEPVLVSPTISETPENLQACDEESETAAEEILQSWQRFRLIDGTERLEGTLSVHFLAGERIRHCHLPVSPAFQSVPEGWCESSDSDVQVEFSLLQTYGVRVSARRGLRNLDDRTIELSIVLVSAQPSRSAA